MKAEVNVGDNYIDSRDVIARQEDLQDTLTSAYDEYLEEVQEVVEELSEGGTTPGGEMPEAMTFTHWVQDTSDNSDATYQEEAEEYMWLENLIDECDGVVDWKYGATLIREAIFEDYARELAEDIGAIDSNATWPLQHINWTEAAEALRMDYTEVDFGGVAYLVRN